MSISTVWRIAAAFLLSLGVSAHAAPPVYGWVEYVDLELDGEVTRIKAKLDSGARSSSLHAIDIDVFRRDGKRRVRFTVPLTDGPDGVKLELPVTRVVRIKRHEGPYDRRPVVKVPVCFGARWHEIEVSLTDRSRFLYPLLLGRRALADHAVINPARTYLHPPDCSSSTDG